MLGRLDHFEVLRFLGRGGMSDVYLARDTHLDCDVALKVLREEHAVDATRRARLLGEAHALAMLDHPNIVGILDCAEAVPDPPGFLWQEDGGFHPTKVVYLAMRFVAGVDLDEALKSRRLPVSRALDWAIQIASGLEAAHERGVVHRDLKPANIRVTPEGVLRIVDFGLAGSLRSRVDSVARTESPSREFVVGSLGYSAPEQGDRPDHADARCDLFSLGAILYEMVAGRPAFEGDSPKEVREQVEHADPPPLERFTRDVPPELERIVGKLLEKDPRRRFQSAHEVRTDLQRLARSSRRRQHWRRAAGWLRASRPFVAGLGLAALVAAGAWFVFRHGPAPARAVAIIEFENRTGDPRLDDVVAGLGLDLMTTLVRCCRVSVVVSALHDGAGRPVRMADSVARYYGVQEVLCGNLSRAGPRPEDDYVLHVWSVRAADNRTPWAHERAAPSNALDQLRQWLDDVVVRHWPRVRDAQAAVAEALPRDGAEATEAYLRGLARLEESDPVVRDSAIADFDRALALDPGFGRALAGRARAWLARYLATRDTSALARAGTDARAAAALAPAEIEGRIALARVLRERGRGAGAVAELRAVLAINDRHAEAYSLLGSAYQQLGNLDGARGCYETAVTLQPASPRAWRALGAFLAMSVDDYAGAERAFRREIALTPDRNRGYEDLAATYGFQCRYAEALATYAKRPHPEERSVDFHNNRGTAYFFSGRYREALDDFLQAVSESPHQGDWRMGLGDCYAHLGRGADARREYAQACRDLAAELAASPGDLERRARYAMGLAKAGRAGDARAEVGRCVAADPWRDAKVVHLLARAAALCGDRDLAFAALDTLAGARGFAPCLLRVEEEFAGLRADPRFRRVLEQR